MCGLFFKDKDVLIVLQSPIPLCVHTKEFLPYLVYDTLISLHLSNRRQRIRINLLGIWICFRKTRLNVLSSHMHTDFNSTWFVWTLSDLIVSCTTLFFAFIMKYLLICPVE